MRDSGEQTSYHATVASHRVNYHWSVPIWVVWKLTALKATGWGYNPSTLRLNSRGAFIAAGGFLLFTILEYVPFFVHFVHPPSIEGGVALLLHGFAPVIIGNAALSLLFAISGIIQWRRAEAGAPQAPVTVDGYCFDSVLVRSLPLFALIGMTHEQARWFSLPIEWDTVVEPGDDRFELTYTPATGFVERLRRIGAEPQELRQ